MERITLSFRSVGLRSVSVQESQLGFIDFFYRAL